ncbi:UBP-type zinc finger domain-containing protein [Nocardioides sp. B-3]|uniref:UBP-type zinc finger domain-containing protein n=1 Tax=Nocardioides sp. B-3 TaxID=2895565 RepID=UPI0021537DD8|nr:UBP-type zinc finger domain-containing protein [Nocardioides sp. B-3]UUZ60746.1 UBP-type zinc finger domain-containing protein [Nocardioides sp. B-3]
MIDAERQKVLKIRSTGTVPSEVVREVLSILDVEESMLDISTTDHDADAPRVRRIPTGRSCDHLDTAGHAPVATAEDGLVCEQCIELGSHWVSLRRCPACGNVACCDSSPHKHATEHFHDSAHPVMQSAQPGEDWRWCFVHHLTG